LFVVKRVNKKRMSSNSKSHKKRMSNNKVLCTCYKCMRKEEGGCYVDSSTRWRHINKEKRNRYILNDDNYETETDRLVFICLLV